jgi:hypothetical protein
VTIKITSLLSVHFVGIYPWRKSAGRPTFDSKNDEEKPEKLAW